MTSERHAHDWRAGSTWLQRVSVCRWMIVSKCEWVWVKECNECDCSVQYADWERERVLEGEEDARAYLKLKWNSGINEIVW